MRFVYYRTVRWLIIESRQIDNKWRWSGKKERYTYFLSIIDWIIRGKLVSFLWRIEWSDQLINQFVISRLDLDDVSNDNFLSCRIHCVLFTFTNILFTRYWSSFIIQHKFLFGFVNRWWILSNSSSMSKTSSMSFISLWRTIVSLC